MVISINAVVSAWVFEWVVWLGGSHSESMGVRHRRPLVGWISRGGRDERGVGVGPDGRPVMSCHKPFWGVGGIEPRRLVGWWVRGGAHW